jgi:hypothetical protein
MINEIKNLMSDVCVDMDLNEKKNFLKTLGFERWDEIAKLDNEQLQDLKTKLTDMKGKQMITFEQNGYIITRPRKPRSVKDIYFTIKGVKLG